MGIGNIATTGMQAAMTKMEVISNNIANVGTSGFKSSSINFADLFPSGGDASAAQAGLGVRIVNVQQDFATGAPLPSTSASDLSISNNGFFIMRDAGSGAVTYSRYGKFAFTNGYFSVGNQRLQGFPAVNNTIPAGSAPVDLFIDTTPMAPQATSEVQQQQLNLNSNTSPPSQSPLDINNQDTYNFSTTATIFDSLGNPHPLTMYYINQSPNNWTVTAYVDTSTAVGTGSLQFSTSGTLTSSTGLDGLSFSPTTGAATPQLFDIDMTGAIQVAGKNSANEFTKDGYQAGTFTTYEITKDGKLIAKYSNQQTNLIGQVAIAKFQSPEGLRNVGNMSWVPTTESGNPDVNQDNSLQGLAQFSLEQSNVDLAEEMVNLITAQSIFQANAQVQQTYSQVMQTVTQL